MAAGILCGIAVIGIVAVMSEAEDGALTAKLIYATVALTVFSLVGLAGVSLSVRRPELAWLGYLTVVAGLVAFALIGRKIWNGDGFFDTGWEVPSSAALIALGLGQVSLLLGWMRQSGPIRLIALAASAAIATLATLGVLATAIDDFEVSPRVLGVLAIVYLLGIALLPLVMLGGKEKTEASPQAPVS
ncbi:MAG TPA: hypothetical protein VFZ29_08255 [Solirubrobacterales bacterium]